MDPVVVEQPSRRSRHEVENVNLKKKNLTFISVILLYCMGLAVQWVGSFSGKMMEHKEPKVVSAFRISINIQIGYFLECRQIQGYTNTEECILLNRDSVWINVVMVIAALSILAGFIPLVFVICLKKLDRPNKLRYLLAMGMSILLSVTAMLIFYFYSIKHIKELVEEEYNSHHDDFETNLGWGFYLGLIGLVTDVMSMILMYTLPSDHGRRRPIR